MTAFVFTPEGLQLIRDKAGALTAAELAKRLRCNVDTLRNICELHGIELIGDGPADPTKPIPRLDPKLRGNLLLVGTQLQLGRQAAAIFDREAARRHTTSAILMAVALEIIAADGLFAAVFDQ
jgi:hypothetical protein